MTCIAGYKDDNGDIIIAADSHVSYGDMTRSNSDKVFGKGNILFGVSGALRQCQILQFDLVMPEHPENVSDLAYLSAIFGGAFRQKLKDCDAWYCDSGRPDANINGIAAYNGELYHMSTDLAFLRSGNKYETSGSGSEIALGALAAMENTSEPKHKQLIRAIEIAAKYIQSVDSNVNYKILRVA